MTLTIHSIEGESFTELISQDASNDLGEVGEQRTFILLLCLYALLFLQRLLRGQRKGRQWGQQMVCKVHRLF